ncbi:hypothetical protein AGLY_001484 [Aphis glycines]|uniref:Uncharacterized protein n=1 Tax=Aphis glycines TaxID=307491 RepID=A0A6G0U5B1_APHGL|nr:hypothetical protein AGLY_001484 [Aphis glycines]
MYIILWNVEIKFVSRVTKLKIKLNYNDKIPPKRDLSMVNLIKKLYRYNKRVFDIITVRLNCRQFGYGYEHVHKIVQDKIHINTFYMALMIHSYENNQSNLIKNLKYQRNRLNMHVHLMFTLKSNAFKSCKLIFNKIDKKKEARDFKFVQIAVEVFIFVTFSIAIKSMFLSSHSSPDCKHPFSLMMRSTRFPTSSV